MTFGGVFPLQILLSLLNEDYGEYASAVTTPPMWLDMPCSCVSDVFFPLLVLLWLFWWSFPLPLSAFAVAFCPSGVFGRSLRGSPPSAVPVVAALWCCFLGVAAWPGRIPGFGGRCSAPPVQTDCAAAPAPVVLSRAVSALVLFLCPVVQSSGSQRLSVYPSVPFCGGRCSVLPPLGVSRLVEVLCFPWLLPILTGGVPLWGVPRLFAFVLYC